jgi:hypothetical protein
MIHHCVGSGAQTDTCECVVQLGSAWRFSVSEHELHASVRRFISSALIYFCYCAEGSCIDIGELRGS